MAKAPVKAPPAPTSPVPGAPVPTPPAAGGTEPASGVQTGEEHFEPGAVTPPGGSPIEPVTPPAANTSEGVEPEVGGQPIASTEPPAPPVPTPSLDEVVDAAKNPEKNLGDWDGNGKAGGSAPAKRADADKSSTELGTEVGVSHGRSAKKDDKPATLESIRATLKTGGAVVLPNGKPIDDEFYNAYVAGFKAEQEASEIDGMSVEDRLARLERAAGLRTPR